MKTASALLAAAILGTIFACGCAGKNNKGTTGTDGAGLELNGKMPEKLPDGLGMTSKRIKRSSLIWTTNSKTASYRTSRYVTGAHGSMSMIQAQIYSNRTSCLLTRTATW